MRCTRSKLKCSDYMILRSRNSLNRQTHQNTDTKRLWMIKIHPIQCNASMRTTLKSVSLWTSLQLDRVWFVIGFILMMAAKNFNSQCQSSRSQIGDKVNCVELYSSYNELLWTVFWKFKHSQVGSENFLFQRQICNPSNSFTSLNLSLIWAPPGLWLKSSRSLDPHALSLLQWQMGRSQSEVWWEQTKTEKKKWGRWESLTLTEVIQSRVWKTNKNMPHQNRIKAHEAFMPSWAKVKQFQSNVTRWAPCKCNGWFDFKTSQPLDLWKFDAPL